MRVIVYSLDGENVIVEVPGSLTIEQILELPRIPKDAKVLDDSELPDRYFRGAWKHGASLSIDMAKAKEIHMAKIKESINIKIKDVNSDAEAKALRDIPSKLNLDQAQTPEQLKAMVPAEIQDALRKNGR